MNSSTNPVVVSTSHAPPLGRVLVGEVLDQLKLIPDASVDCVVTSPPYFRLRNYQEPGQIGMEETIQDWVTRLADVMDGLRRVLKPTGTIWLNLGDSYSRHAKYGADPKGLLLGPERLAVELSRRGFIVRNKVVWAKSNPMPSSVKDRLATTWEPIYLLAISPTYYFDLDAIRVEHRSIRKPNGQEEDAKPRLVPEWQGPLAGVNDGLDRLKARGQVGHSLGKNPGDVWRRATSNYRGAHFATFPEKLIEPAILAGCPARVCVSCGEPWARKVAKSLGHLAVAGELKVGCGCGGWWRRGVVLDPFMGAGTTAVVAERLGRDWVGIDLSEDFARLARKRLERHRKREADKRRDERRAAAGVTKEDTDSWNESTKQAA